MSISGKQTDFTGYELPDSGVVAAGAPYQWSRSDAMKDFDYFVSTLGERIVMLDRLTTRNDGPKLDFTDESVALLNDWFVDRAEPDPDQENWPGGLTSEWYSVVGDMKAYLGEVLRKRKPNLHWVLWTRSKKDVAYQTPVIAGFNNVPNKNYNVDYGRIIAMLGQRIVQGDLREDSRRILLNVLLDDVASA
ncbi:hypothetical protein P5V65_08910 [Mycobacteroides abscessus subsp. abscessus]|uniref:hypothetical protein n=1 Tax=Mycobacteroides abscessus TaxID=36809 RepID=UPI00266BB523|nr:hypothetical protein [Mycobacteroides abscessus]MDO3019349.1 hypothetical protein [Mycobacteroides abscessus subsp. abscessus]